MRRSTTSAATDRRRLAAILVTELICAVLLIGRPQAPPANPVVAAPASLTTPTAASTTETLDDGRTIHLVGLGGSHTAPLLARIAAQMNDAARAVTAFWGPDWPRDVVIVAAGSDAEFGTLAGGGPDIAATTTAERIMFAPGAAAMSDASLRIVVRHELFHFASRSATAADAPRWLTEGVADYVGRPAAPRPPDAAQLAQLPSDADLNAAGPAGSSAYDRAWWFSRFVAESYGTQTLRALYLRACGPGHPDAATAVRDTLGADLPTVLVRWRHWMPG
ncbi:peptidase [Mycobacterium sp.]|uniref:peptidase n=1 Tax=Mycobacterium sp. TaxID=1785 RepID=UPI002C78BB56|nr:peptidase [Mycobacterium sp.]HTH85367.1 peptidase [Mycobacterium sp.]